MEKRGVSHIEVILAFLLFITAIIAAFYFFNPGNNSRIVSSFISYAESAVEKEAGTSIEIYSLKLNNDKFQGKEAISVKLDSLKENDRVRVETYSGEGLSSGVSGKIVSFNPGTNNFVYIKTGSEMPSGTMDNFPEVNESYYQIISENSKDLLSEVKIVEMKKKYDSNYEGLKKELNIPARMNFDYSLTFSDKTSIQAAKEIPKNVEVYSEIKREEVLRESGVVEFADLMVRVW